MKKLLLILTMVGLAVGPAQAFLYEIQAQEPVAIAKMSDQTLKDTYVDVLVELEAVSMFYQASGLNPSEFKKLKTLIKYRFYLLEEIQKRNLSVPQVK